MAQRAASLQPSASSDVRERLPALHPVAAEQQNNQSACPPDRPPNWTLPAQKEASFLGMDLGQRAKHLAGPPRLPTDDSPAPPPAPLLTPEAKGQNMSPEEEQALIKAQLALSMADAIDHGLVRQAIPPFFPHSCLSPGQPTEHPLLSDDACRVMTVCFYGYFNLFSEFARCEHCHQ